MKMLALAFVLALVHLAAGDFTCTTDEDCSLNGVCIRNGTHALTAIRLFDLDCHTLSNSHTHPSHTGVHGRQLRL
jgi:hypothetical protein